MVIEGGGEVAGEFKVLELVFADRDVCCTVRVHDQLLCYLPCVRGGGGGGGLPPNIPMH